MTSSVVSKFGLLLLVLTAGCDQADDGKPADCILESNSDPSTELWLLPTQAEAKKLAEAIKNRHQGTVNLLFAKYDRRTVAPGTTCESLDERDGFVQVKAGNLEGWVPTNHLKGRGN